MEEKEGFKFSRIFYKILIVLFILSAILFLFLCYQLTPDFFLKYSSDGLFKPSTIQKISNLRIFSLSLGIISLIFLVVLYIFKDKTKYFLEKKKQMIINLLLLVLIIAFFFFIMEIILKLLLQNETSEGGFGPGSIKFNQRYVKLNKDLMRDREFSLEKPNNTIRIVVIGDSYTFGSGIGTVNDTYSKVLEKKLNSLNKSKKYEVLNFGIPGYDSPQELEIIKNKALKYNPDMIIIGYSVNDFVNIDSSIKKGSDILALPFIGFWLRQVSYSYYFLETRTNRFLENTGLRTSYKDTLIKVYNSKLNKDYNHEVYKEIAGITKANNISVILVNFPVNHDFENYPFFIIANFTKWIAKDNGFYFIDLMDDFKKFKPEDLIVSKYDRHPNEIAHKIAAEKILEIFINQSI